jgi:hypothetical protein
MPETGSICDGDRFAESISRLHRAKVEDGLIAQSAAKRAEGEAGLRSRV